MNDDRAALTFRITDQSEAAIRSRADQSVLWNEDEGNVPTRIADALWAAVRDRESLLITLDRERAAAREVEARSLSHPHDGYAYDGCTCICCLSIRALALPSAKHAAFAP